MCLFYNILILFISLYILEILQLVLQMLDLISLFGNIPLPACTRCSWDRLCSPPQPWLGLSGYGDGWMDE